VMGEVRAWRSFSGKSWRVNIFSTRGHMASVTTPWVCHCSVKATTETAWTNECGCVPIKLYL
jgi:hypothetical protein